MFVLVAACENFGYRQLTIWYRMKGAWKFIAGEKSWGDMKRRGLGSKAGTA
jgi:hypothetical protein